MQQHQLNDQIGTVDLLGKGDKMFLRMITGVIFVLCTIGLSTQAIAAEKVVRPSITSPHPPRSKVGTSVRAWLRA